MLINELTMLDENEIETEPQFLDFWRSTTVVTNLELTNGISQVSTLTADTREDGHFEINEFVNVMARMWPGMNKQGGVAKVTAVRFDEGTFVLVF